MCGGGAGRWLVVELFEVQVECKRKLIWGVTYVVMTF